MEHWIDRTIKLYILQPKYWQVSRKLDSNQIIFGIWIEIVHNLKGLLDSIKGNMHQAELKRLEFHAIWNIGIFYRRFFYKVEWFYSALKYLFMPMVRI